MSVSPANFSFKVPAPPRVEHHRLLLCPLGRALTTFKCTKELVEFILDAMKGHGHAFTLTGMLHPDVSVKNIRITEGGRGLLVDWDLSKTEEEAASTRHDRMGTWQFVSGVHIEPFEIDDKPHTFLDDIESFLHVLTWMTLQFVPAVDKYLEVYRALDIRKFDDFHVYEGRCMAGRHNKSIEFCANRYPSWHFLPKCPTPLWDLIKTLASPFRWRYLPDPPTDQERAEIRVDVPFSTYDSDEELQDLYLKIRCHDRVTKQIESSTWFVKTIEAALQEDGWPSDDQADDSSHKYWTGRSRWRRRNPYDCDQPFELIEKRSASRTPERAAKRHRASVVAPSPPTS